MLLSCAELAITNCVMLLIAPPIIRWVVYRRDPNASRLSRIVSARAVVPDTLPIVALAAAFPLLMTWDEVAPKSWALFDKMQVMAIMMGAVGAYANAVINEVRQFTTEVYEYRREWIPWFGTDTDEAISKTVWRSLKHKMSLSPLSAAVVEVILLGGIRASGGDLPPLDIASQKGTEQELLNAAMMLISIRVLFSFVRSAVDPTGLALRNFLMVFPGIRIEGAPNSGRSTEKRRYDSQLSHGMSMSRWRGKEHISAFRGARALMRSISGLKRKAPRAEYERLRCTCARLAYLMKSVSLDMKPGVWSQHRVDFALAGISLIVKENLIKACEQAHASTSGFTVPNEEENRSKRTSVLLLESIDGFMQRNARVLLFTLGVLILLAYLMSGGTLLAAIEKMLPLFPA